MVSYIVLPRGNEFPLQTGWEVVDTTLGADAVHKEGVLFQHYWIPGPLVAE